jgi:hypothetical protein
VLVLTPAALTKLSAMRLRRGWSRSSIQFFLSRPPRTSSANACACVSMLPLIFLGSSSHLLLSLLLQRSRHIHDGRQSRRPRFVGRSPRTTAMCPLRMEEATEMQIRRWWQNRSLGFEGDRDAAGGGSDAAMCTAWMPRGTGRQQRGTAAAREGRRGRLGGDDGGAVDTRA